MRRKCFPRNRNSLLPIAAAVIFQRHQFRKLTVGNRNSLLPIAAAVIFQRHQFPKLTAMGFAYALSNLQNVHDRYSPSNAASVKTDASEHPSALIFSDPPACRSMTATTCSTVYPSARICSMDVHFDDSLAL